MAEAWQSTQPEVSHIASSMEALAAKYDASDMVQVIEGVPRQIDTALDQPLPPLPSGPFERVIIAGMGGSTSPVEILSDAFSAQLKAPVQALREYSLPTVDDKTLVIVSSFSGNTEETLSVIDGLPHDATNVVVVAAKGRLVELAQERRYPFVHVPTAGEPAGFQPRSAVGYFVTFFARILATTGVMADASRELREAAAFLRSASIRADAEDTALWLRPRIPVVYTDEIHVMSIGRVVKIKFNENSKRPSFFNALPEANHNEMIGYTQPLGEFGILYMHDPASHPRVLSRFEVMRDVFRDEGISNVEFWKWDIPGETKIQKIFAGLAFGDWCSYTLALLDGCDPTPVPLVETFKTALVKHCER